MNFRINKIITYQNSIIFLITLNLICSFFLPIALNANAPHDDTLFFRLGLEFSSLNWLGNYFSGTFLKGPIFPIFIGISQILDVPLRFLESVLIIFCSFYFIKSLEKMNFDKIILLLIFFLLIFYPFNNSAANYRLLREIIYPWFLLLIISELIYIYYNIINDSKLKIYFFNSLKLGLFLFLFWNTREEGLFIIPTIILTFSLILFFNLNKLKSVITVIIISFSFLLLLNNILKNINSYFYGHPIIVEFKDKNYVKGMNAFFRVKQNIDYKFAAPSKETWKKIFENSKSAKKLESYVFGPGYEGWAKMACDHLNISHFENHGLKKNYNCNGRMPAGFMLFSIRDAFKPIGIDNPKDLSRFMKDIHEEIDAACKNGKLDCHDIPDILLPFETYTIQTLKDAIKFFPLSLTTSLMLPIPAPNTTFSSGSKNDLQKMSSNLKSKIFPTPNNLILDYKVLDYDKEFFKDLSYGITSKESVFNFIEYNNSGILKIGGTININNITQSNFIINIDNKKICYPKIIINNENSDYFLCEVYYPLKENEKIFLKVFYINKNTELIEIETAEEIEKALLNKFDEKCYLENNPDVQQAVNQKIFLNGYEHWLKHGINELRKCSPLYKNIIENKIENDFNNNIFSKISFKTDLIYFQIFKVIYFLILPLIFLFFYIVYKTKDYFPIILCVLLFSASLTRITILSVFHVNYMAPISAHYLSLSIFINHLIIIILFSYSLNFIIKRIK